MMRLQYIFITHHNSGRINKKDLMIWLCCDVVRDLAMMIWVIELEDEVVDDNERKLTSTLNSQFEAPRNTQKVSSTLLN